ncbi:MAG: hypothetical protein ACTSSP_06850 [Candidatus Asgardarchaeia archaeon]
MSTTIKIKRETSLRLTKVLGELIAEKGKRMSYDDLINYLLDIFNEFKKKEKTKSKLDEGTKRLLEKIKMSFDIAGPEDYSEYDYEDLGG